VACYYIRSHRAGLPPVLLVDTPGFGDTRGPDQDKRITEKIATFSKTKIDCVDVIAYVIPSSLRRLTELDKYIFQEVLNLFGEDIADNILVMANFCDGEASPVLQALKEDNMPFKQCLPFNNSEIFSTKNDNTTKMFWDMGMEGFRVLFQVLAQIQKKSLTLTNEVLHHRKSLENNVVAIRPQIDEGLGKLEETMHIISVVKAKKEEINATKGFDITSTTVVWIPINLPPGVHTTTCLICNRTCHDNCSYSDNNDKIKCISMKKGNCMVCPGKCFWHSHKNLPIRYETRTVQKVTKSDDLYRCYCDTTSSKMMQVQLLEGLVKDLWNLQNRVKQQMAEVYQYLEELSRIALSSSPLGVEEYFDVMIQSEESEKKPGWSGRCTTLCKMKQNSRFLLEITQPGYDPFQNQRKETEEMLKNFQELDQSTSDL